MNRVLVGIALAGLLFGSLSARVQAAPAGAQFVANQLLVQFREDATEAGKADALSRVNANARAHIADKASGRAQLVLATLAAGNVDDAIARIAAHPAVEFAERNWIYTHGAASNDPYFTDGSLWGMSGAGTSPANQYGSNAAQAWTAGNTGSASVYVGIIDEGFQPSHPDLDGNVWTNPYDAANGRDDDGNGYIDDVNGWDFANGDSSIYDGDTRGNLDDHGTHVAGTIGGEGGNGAGVVGVNWDVTLISGKFLGRNGGTTANAVKSVDYFTDLKTRHGLNIVATNNSWGGGGYSQALYDAIERANRADILFVAAAGNGDRKGNGLNNDVTPHYPSSYENSNIISVASITSTGAKSSFSNYGAKTVDIGAPGSTIYSTLAYNSYGAYSGTSMATPHVTGAVALYASVKPGSSAAAIKTAIISSAVPTSSLSGSTPVATGGRLDAGAALSK